MPIAAINVYLERLPARQAELKLMLADVVSYPHIKKDQQDTAMKKWLREANANVVQKAKVASPAILRLMGIGVNRDRK